MVGEGKVMEGWEQPIPGGRRQGVETQRIKEARARGVTVSGVQKSRRQTWMGSAFSAPSFLGVAAPK